MPADADAPDTTQPRGGAAPAAPAPSLPSRRALRAEAEAARRAAQARATVEPADDGRPRPSQTGPWHQPAEPHGAAKNPSAASVPAGAARTAVPAAPVPAASIPAAPVPAAPVPAASIPAAPVPAAPVRAAQVAPIAPAAQVAPAVPSARTTRPAAVAPSVEPALVMDVSGRMNLLAQVLDAGGDRLQPASVTRAVNVLDRAGARMQLGAELTVVALVGATGSGKSSMFNALAGMEIAEVTARRPTTSEAEACLWGDSDADSLLDWLGIPLPHRTRRESVLDADREAPLHGLVLLDLPDHDSAFVHHRLEVDRLVDMVDLLIWVVDPQKYADEALHSGYLRPYADRGDVMLVVLNQIDKLGPDEVHTCERDLRRLLDGDGLSGVRLLTASARRGDGVEDLRSAIAATVQQRASAVDRTVTDLAAAAGELARGIAAAEPDLDRLGAAGTLVADLADAAGVPVLLGALDADYRRRANAWLGWPFLRWWRRLRPDPLRQLGLNGTGAELRDLIGSSLAQPTPSQQAQVDLAARAVADAVAAGLPPRWAFAVRSASGWHRGGTGLSAALDAAVRQVPILRSSPWWWPVVGVLQILLAAASVAGFGWLAAIGVLDWVRSAPSEVPFLGPLPLPTAMLVGGLVLGGLTAAGCAVLIDRAARRRRQDLAAQLDAAIGEVARAWVLDPVADVLADHREVREALTALR